MADNFQERLGKTHERYLTEGSEHSIVEIAERIITLTHNLAHYWSGEHAMVPGEVAEALKQARLDRIVSLAESLRRWVIEPTLSDGDLILAWANLGGVMEGALKLFLTVYISEYQADDISREARTFHVKKQVLTSPDKLVLDAIFDYLRRAKILAQAQLSLGADIQNRRNSLHAFREREIGTTEELWSAIRGFRAMLLSLNARLPYLDRYSYPVPGELTRMI